MKILILQLARLGDIYLTWPTVHALRKKFPGANLQFLCRSYYQSATVGMSQIDKVWAMPTALLLEPLFKEADQNSMASESCLSESIAKFGDWAEKIKAERFDLIINLSFSPFSSYLTHFLTENETQVRGYTRTNDGYLSLPDDGAAYFYAQVGVGRSNRFHLSDLFAEIAGVGIVPDDWVSPLALLQQSPFFKKGESSESSFRICVHVGASASYKCLRSEPWAQVLKFIAEEYEKSNLDKALDLFLVGTQAEGSGISLPENRNVRVHNVCGKTQLIDVFALVQSSDLVVGCDSVVIHMASLAKIPCFNFSFSTVNFYETGPIAEGSRVLYSEFPEMLNSRRAAKEIVLMAQSASSYGPLVTRFENKFSDFSPSFEWDLIRALYLGETFPKFQNPKVLSLLVDTFHFGLQQLDSLEVIDQNEVRSERVNSMKKSTLQVFDQVSGLMKALETQAPEISPLLRWFQTELIRVPQGDFRSVLLATKEIYSKSHAIAVYWREVNSQDQIQRSENARDLF